MVIIQSTAAEFLRKRQEVRLKALKALAGYKFIMFGYHAAIWVTLNGLCPKKERNPFRSIVAAARKEIANETS